MKELIDKLSSYNIFNYLLPGVVFVIVLSKVTNYNYIQDGLLTGAFFYYFIGLIISRVGSVIIEPILKKISFVKFLEYARFVRASKNDSKLDVLSEVNNMYRTICALILLEIIFIFYEKMAELLKLPSRFGAIILLIILFILFLFSYQKQTDYITKRVESNEKTEQNDMNNHTTNRST